MLIRTGFLCFFSNRQRATGANIGYVRVGLVMIGFG